jgi:nucleotide-binding universal stress UspA family protein
MFSEIVVVFDDLPESQRALHAAIDLARACNAELATVSILGDLPPTPHLPSFYWQLHQGRTASAS